MSSSTPSKQHLLASGTPVSNEGDRSTFASSIGPPWRRTGCACYPMPSATPSSEAVLRRPHLSSAFTELWTPGILIDHGQVGAAKSGAEVVRRYMDRNARGRVR